jgi:hypothetical protein
MRGVATLVVLVLAALTSQPNRDQSNDSGRRTADERRRRVIVFTELLVGPE